MQQDQEKDFLMGKDRMKKTKYIILAFMFLFPVVSFCEERIMSLEDCLKAAQNSQEIKIQEAKVKEYKFKYEYQRGFLFPQLDASISYLRYGQELPSKKALFGSSLDDYYTDISLKQTLFAGGKYSSLADANRYVFESEREKLNQTRQTVYLAVKKAYYEQIRLNYTLKIQKELICKLKEQFSITQILYNSGKLSNLDVLKIKTQIALSEDVLANIKESVYTKALVLGQMVGINEPIYASDDLSEQNENIRINTGCLDNKFRENPEIKYVLKLKEKSNSDIAVSRSDFFPSLQFRANYFLEDAKFFPGNPNWYAGISVNIPLFHGGSIVSQVNQAKQKYEQSAETVKQTELSLITRFQSSRALIVDKKNRLDSAKKVLDLAQETLNATELKYNAGKLTTIEMIDSYILWINSQLNYKNNYIDYLIAISEIEYICPTAIIREAQK